MKKAIIIYESTNHNTENLVGSLCRAVRKAGVCDVTIKDVTETNVNELYDYDRILLASSVCRNDKLQNGFINFYEEMKELDLKGKKISAFGTGASSWEHFCAAVDILEEQLKKCGAEVSKGFKVDGEVAPVKNDAVNWVLGLTK